MNKLKKDLEEKKRNCIDELKNLEKKFGSEIFSSACNKKLIIDRQTEQRLEHIKKLEQELNQLKSGKPIL